MQRKTLSKAKTTSRSSHLQKQSVVKSAAKHPLMALHQSIGNRAVQRLIQSHYIQAKLEVSTPGDQYEQEADRVADKVMRTPDAQVDKVQRGPVTAEEENEKEEEMVQGKAAEGGGNQVSQGVQSQIESFRGG